MAHLEEEQFTRFVAYRESLMDELDRLYAANPRDEERINFLTQEYSRLQKEVQEDIYYLPVSPPPVVSPMDDEEPFGMPPSPVAGLQAPMVPEPEDASDEEHTEHTGPNICEICITKKIDHVAECGHCMCESCIKRVHDVCPFCRKYFTFKLRIFLPV